MMIKEKLDFTYGSVKDQIANNNIKSSRLLIVTEAEYLIQAKEQNNNKFVDS